MRITKYDEGPTIYMEVIVVYGYNIIESIKDFREKCIKEIDKLTAMNIREMEIVARGIKLKEE